MEPPAPFDLTQRLAVWRTTLRASGALSSEQLDELEDHLRLSFAGLQGKGLADEEAWVIALQRVGQPKPLANEFLKASPERIVAAYLYGLLLRNRWKIVSCTAAGMVAAAAVFVLKKPIYSSEAMVLYRQVSDTSPLVSAPDNVSADVVNTEVQILKSRDIAKQTSELVAQARHPAVPAAAIEFGLEVQPVPASSVLIVRYSNRDPALVQPILTSVLDVYLKKHIAIHHDSAMTADFLSQETDALRSRLSRTEEEMREAKAKAGVISIDEAETTFAHQEADLQQAIQSANVDLEAKRAYVESYTAAPATIGTVELRESKAEMAALRSRINALNEQLAQVRLRADRVAQQTPVLHDLQREFELNSADYKYYQQRLQAVRIGEAFGAGRALNVALIQAPTAPYADRSPVRRLVVLLCTAGFGLGLIWTLATELLIKRLLREPNDDIPGSRGDKLTSTAIQ